MANDIKFKFMDPIEIGLISKFFHLDCLDVLGPNIDAIKSLPLNDSRELRKIGESNYKNIVNFYYYEFKDNESEFWNMFVAKDLLKDKNMELIVSKLPYNYFWLDYVTDVRFSFRVIDGSLHFEYFNLSTDLHLRSLELIVRMIFLSDFKRERKCLSIQFEWEKMLAEVKLLNKQIG